MKRVCTCFILCVAGSLLAGEPATTPIPQSARWVLHLELQRLKQSELGPLIQVIAQRPEPKKGLEELQRRTNIDLLADIDNVSVFGKDSNEETAVVAIAGKLDTNHLTELVRNAAEHAEHVYKKRTIHQWQDGKRNHPSLGCFASDHLLLIGNTDEMIQLCIDTLDGTKPANAIGDEFNSASTLAICSVTDLQGLRGANPKAAILQQLKELRLRLEEKENQFTLMLEAQADSAQSAQNVKSIADGLRALAILNKQQDANGDAVAEKVQTLCDGNVVRLTVSIPAETATAWLQDRLKQTAQVGPGVLATPRPDQK